MDNWEKAHGLFAYELASGILVALVLQGQLRKTTATTLIRECLEHLQHSFPNLQEELGEIAAKGTAQIEVLSIMEGGRE